MCITHVYSCGMCIVCVHFYLSAVVCVCMRVCVYLNVCTGFSWLQGQKPPQAEGAHVRTQTIPRQEELLAERPVLLGLSHSEIEVPQKAYYLGYLRITKLTDRAAGNRISGNFLHRQEVSPVGDRDPSPGPQVPALPTQRAC